MKYTKQLRILGGEACFKEKLHVGRPNVGDRHQLLEYFNDILDRKWFSNGGQYVQELEQRLETYLGVEHCVVTSNATVGLEIAARAAELEGEVIVPAFTFVATAHALRWLGLTPVLCDVDPETHNLDPEQVEKCISPRTSAIVGVHLWGRPCDIHALEDIAKRYELKLMFDAAHAFGCSYNGSMIGTFGDAEIFSFHATKFFNTFEGGAIATNDAELADRVRLMKNFGFAGYDQVNSLGINGKMNEFSAAMGLTSLESVDDFIEVNRKNYFGYQKGLEDIDGIELISVDLSQRNNFQYVVVSVNESQTGISRDELLKVLWMENIMARRYFYPGVHLMEPYRTDYANSGADLPVTERLSSELLVLPTGTAVNVSQIKQICSILDTAINKADLVRDAVTSRG